MRLRNMETVGSAYCLLQRCSSEGIFRPRLPVPGSHHPRLAASFDRRRTVFVIAVKPDYTAVFRILSRGAARSAFLLRISYTLCRIISTSRKTKTKAPHKRGDAQTKQTERRMHMTIRDIISNKPIIIRSPFTSFR